MKFLIVILFLLLPCKKIFNVQFITDSNHKYTQYDGGLLLRNGGNLKGLNLVSFIFKKVTHKDVTHSVCFQRITSHLFMQYHFIGLTFASGLSNYQDINQHFNIFLSGISFQRSKWNFIVFFTIIGLLAIFLFARLRLYILVRIQQKVEQQVQRRTQELAHNNYLREQLTLLMAHDLQSPLHFLSILSGHVHKSALKNDMNSVIEGCEEIRSTTSKISSFIEEVNLWNKSLSENYKLKITSFPVQSLINELVSFFEIMVGLKNNILEVTYSDSPIITTDKDILKAILRNIIDNANKYTYNGKIKINIGKDDQNHLVLSIQDSGKGMTVQELEKIQQRIESTSSTPGMEKNDRLGFQFIVDFVSRIGAKLTITSEENTGTTITITGINCVDN